MLSSPEEMGEEYKYTINLNVTYFVSYRTSAHIIMSTNQHNSEYEEEDLVSPLEEIDDVTSSEDKRQVDNLI